MSSDFLTCSPAESFCLAETGNAAGALDSLKFLKQILAFIGSLGITLEEATALASEARDLFEAYTADKLLNFLRHLLAAIGDEPKKSAGDTVSTVAIPWATIFTVIKWLIEYFSTKE